jgi:radical SAM superfamily enzyme YgiQ (UPF0313 family)
MFCEPIGLEIVYGVLKGSNEVRLLDLMIEKEQALDELMKTFQPRVVGFTSLCIDVNAVKRLAGKVKALSPSVITMVGGTQAFLNPSAFFDPGIDHVFKYTNQDNLQLLMQYIEADKDIPAIDGIYSADRQYQSTPVAGKNQYLIPDRSCTAKYHRYYSYFGYRPCAIMQTSLGCSKHCDYCLRWRIEGANEAEIDLECIIKQIEDIQAPSIMIYDNDFLTNGERLERLCAILEQKGIRKNFISYASVYSIIAHPHVVKRMAQNGLKAVLVGYESFSEQELQSYRKKSSVTDSLKASRILKENGIDCWASFMLHPDWSKKDFRQLRKFIKTLSPEISTFSPLTPFPNLPMFQQYQERLLVDVDDYESWNFGKVTIRPSRLSLRQYYWEVLKTLLYINFIRNSAGYLVRRFGFRTLFRLTRGAMRVFPVYVRLMFQGPPFE